MYFNINYFDLKIVNQNSKLKKAVNYIYIINIMTFKMLDIN